MRDPPCDGEFYFEESGLDQVDGIFIDHDHLDELIPIIYQSYTTDLSEVNTRCSNIFDERIKLLEEEHKRSKKNPNKNPSDGAKKSRQLTEGKSLFPFPTPGDKFIIQIQKITQDNNIRPDNWVCGDYINIDRALIHLEFAHGHYTKVQEFIRQLKKCCDLLSEIVKAELKDLWDRITIQSALCRKESNNDKIPPNLEAVQRFRLKKRNPCPIEEGGKYGISFKALEALKQLYMINVKPSKEQRDQLMECYGMTKERVNNWFKNRRQRSKKQSEPKVNDEMKKITESQKKRKRDHNVENDVHPNEQDEDDKSVKRQKINDNGSIEFDENCHFYYFDTYHSQYFNDASFTNGFYPCSL